MSLVGLAASLLSKIHNVSAVPVLPSVAAVAGHRLGASCRRVGVPAAGLWSLSPLMLLAKGKQPDGQIDVSPQLRNHLVEWGY